MRCRARFPRCESCSRKRVSSMAKKTNLQTPVPLEKGHEVAGFDCGSPPLNDYLRKHALQNHQNRSARTYVVLRIGRVVGYYSLAAASVERDSVPSRVAKGLGAYPVPVFLLARLAV